MEIKENLRPEVMEVVENFMLFVRSVREFFETDDPIKHLYTPSRDISQASLKRGWDKAAKVWPAIESEDNYSITMYSLLERMQFNERRRNRLLSLGSGPAIYEQWLARILGLDFYLADFSWEMGALCRWIEKRMVQASGMPLKAKGKIFPVTMSIDKLGFRDGSFDSIISINALHWLANWKESLAEMRRLLDPKSLRMIYLVVTLGAHKFQDDKGQVLDLADIKPDTLMDAMEAEKFQMLFTRIMLVREGQLGLPAKRIFVHAQLNEKSFTSWRAKKPERTVSLVRDIK